MASRNQKPITVFSIAALLVLLMGGGGTLIYTQLRLDGWMRSGMRFPIGPITSIDLPAGDHVVFYESPDVLPSDPSGVHLTLKDALGAKVECFVYGLDPEEDYAPRTIFPSTSMLGRPIWRLNLPSAGTYTFRPENDHEEQNVQLDRVVFNKDRPQSFKAFHESNRELMFVMLMIIGAIVIGLYVMHAVTLSKRASAPIERPTLVPLEDDR